MKTNHCIPMKNQKIVNCLAVVILSLVLNSSLSGSSFHICGNISTYEGIPVQHARIQFTATEDTANKFIAITDADGNYSLLITKVARHDGGSRSYELIRNYPNPFHDVTNIQYQLQQGGEVTIIIYDMLGRAVKTFAPERQRPGIYHALWNGTNNSGQKVRSGIYFLRLTTPELTVTRKLVYLPGIHLSSSSSILELPQLALHKNSIIESMFKRFNITIESMDNTQPNIWSFAQDSVDISQDTVMNFLLFELTSTWQPLGLSGKHVNELVLAGDSLYACAAKAGLFRLNLAGRDTVWEYLGFADTAGNPNYWGPDAVFIDPATKWIFVGLEIHEWSGMGLFRSEDQGNTWQPSDSGISQYFSMISPSVYSLSGSSRPQHVLLAGMSSAIFKSEDGGLSWRHVWGLLHGGNWVYAIEVNPSYPNEIWAGGGTGRETSLVLHSCNYAESWLRIESLPSPFDCANAVYDIAIDPINIGTVYLSMMNGILKSSNFGHTWTEFLGKKNYSFWCLKTNPNNSKELLVIGDYLYRTIDSGQSWHFRLPPERLKFKWALTLDWKQKVIYVSNSNLASGIFKLAL